MTRSVLVLAILSALAAPVSADTALLIGNASYDNASNVSGARSLRLAEMPLREAGFDVYTGTDVVTSTIRDGLSRVVEAEEDSRIIIALSGHFVQSADGEVWFLGTDADQPDRGDVGDHGVALSTVMAIAAEAPGRALVLLGTDSRAVSVGAGLAPGVSLPAPPQGVTLALGSPRDVAQMARQVLPRRGISLSESLPAAGFETAGFLSDAVPFLAPREGAVSVPSTPVPVSPGASSEEQELWEAVQELNTEGAYISYLRQYPTGAYAAEARAAFEALRDPLRIAAEAETALGLDRSDRRQIQSDLTVLGYDTNGIDGIFGNGTRGAIRAWQAGEGLEQTGYMTSASLRILGDQAAIRRAEIEAEEAVRAAERDRLDRTYWAATGRGADEPGLRAYLARYPEGLYSDIAQDRLAEIDGIRAEEAAAEDAAAWDFATRQDSVRAYRGYLAVFPEGAHARDAANRIAELRGEPVPFPEVDIAALQAREAQLNLPSITRLLIERRLQGEGYNPGPADGRFDDQTRAAIRAFQEAEGVDATGYLDQQTLQRFLAGGIQVIIR